eukprot:4550106-Prymnesium_polylepis.2
MATTRRGWRASCCAGSRCSSPWAPASSAASASTKARAGGWCSRVSRAWSGGGPRTQRSASESPRVSGLRAIAFGGWAGISMSTSIRRPAEQEMHAPRTPACARTSQRPRGPYAAATRISALHFSLGAIYNDYRHYVILCCLTRRLTSLHNKYTVNHGH